MGIAEKWVAIKGYEDYYQVSNLGRVRSLDRPWKDGYGNPCVRKGKVLKGVLNSRGYVRVELKVNNIGKKFFVHRLVAEHFLENPNNLPVINHKDFNPLNNCVDNLEYCTQLENMQYSQERGRFEHTDEWLDNQKKGLDDKMGKAVVGTEIKTGKSVYFRALNDVAWKGFRPSCVSYCCNGKRPSHKKYTWRFANEDENSKYGNLAQGRKGYYISIND